MSFKPAAEAFLKKALGQDGFEELEKFELWKKKTNTVVDHEEIRTALQIVPRTILSLLQRELTPMKTDEGKEFQLPVDRDAHIQVTKHAEDVYSGEIREASKVIAQFKHRTLPGVGLVIMTTFELYDIADLDRAGKTDGADVSKIQAIIDERLGLRDLITKVVDQRLSEREAIDQLIKLKLTQAMQEAQKADIEPEMKKEDKTKKPLKLKEFLDKKTDKQKAKFELVMQKNETVTCPDCGKDIFAKGIFSGCICYGEDRNKKVFIAKTEEGFSIKFSRAWDVENIEMLLDTLRSKANRSTDE